MSYIAKNGRLYTSGASEALTLLDDKFSVNKSYSKGDSCIYNDYLWKFTSDKPAGEWDSSVVEQCRIMDFVDEVKGQICTNLLNPTAQTQTINGVTFTNNGDGTYTVNGTASGAAVLDLAEFSDISIFENTKLVGCPDGGSLRFRLFATCYNGSTSLKDYVDRGNGVILSNIPSNTTTIRFRIIIVNGNTANNLLFKPMLTTDLNATYDDYVPYTGDSGRLNEDISDVNRRLTQSIDKINEEHNSAWSGVVTVNNKTKLITFSITIMNLPNESVLYTNKDTAPSADTFFYSMMDGNNKVSLQFYPDGRVVLAQLNNNIPIVNTTINGMYISH